jgi:tetratricopeptide (TPR) repeat protein
MLGQSQSPPLGRHLISVNESSLRGCLARVSPIFLLMADASRQTAVFGLFLATAILGGCAGVPARDSNTPLIATSADGRSAALVKLPRTVITPTDASSVDELYAHARADFAESRFADAAREFDRLVELDPEGSFAKEAWLHGGAAHDELGDLEGAATRYQEVARRFPDDPMAREALIRAVRVLTYLEKWTAAGLAADALLAKVRDLGPIERVVAYGGKALALVFSTEPDSASYFIEKGRDVVDTERLDAAGTLPRDLAELYFALGELRRIRGERIKFDPVPPKFADVLETRCQLLLDAQSAYSDTMRAYDAHWSAMAGFRVGELYQKLHAELMRVPTPAAASTPAKAQLFEGAMRLRYATLLRKGLAMMDHTLSLSDRTGERSDWIIRAREAKSAIEASIKDEEAALARLPYSRADLERALEDLGHRKSP